MFKETYGFDIDVFTYKTAIKIVDTYKKSIGFVICAKEEDYSQENMSGTYLISRSSPTEIFVTDANGNKYEFPIRHFIGENPRMSIKILQ